MKSPQHIKTRFMDFIANKENISFFNKNPLIAKAVAKKTLDML